MGGSREKCTMNVRDSRERHHGYTEEIEIQKAR